ncbi:MAG: hypothetical protein O2983_04480 [Planctomycetota bacterium]|nr:hypothetical protein [Planctomycetota bacterium]MDA0919577.1 hypothetical protein [Planctomycetota bacterium]MDA1158845.1 hypothetical protein [Planctomycetota bacterium]
MTFLTRSAAATLFGIAIAVLSSDVATAATARSMLAELSALEKEVKSVSAMGPTGAASYSRKVSDFRSRFLKASDATADQRRDVSKRLSTISSEIRSRTTQTGGSPAKPRSTTGSNGPSKLSSPRSSSSTIRPRSSSSRSRSSFSGSSTSRADSSSRSASQKLRELYVEIGNRYDKLPKAIQAKSGPLTTEALKALSDDIPRFVREYSAAVVQWRKDLSAVRRAASTVPKDDITKSRVLELVEKRYPEKLRDLVADSRKTFVSHTTGLLNYVQGEYASRERQKDNGQFVIWIGSWDMDKCVQTAWDVTDLGIQFEKSFGGPITEYEASKQKARTAAKERAIRLVDRLKEM